MNYRYFQPEYLFDGKKILKNATLVVTEDDAIEGISFEKHQDAVEMKGVLSPGFINCHCHLELSHFKGLIPEGTGMTDFLLEIIKLRKSGLPFIKQAVIDAEKQMADSGIVAVGDICNGTETLSIKKYSGLYFHNFIECFGLNETNAGEIMAKALENYHAFDKFFPGRTSIVPHAPYSVSQALFKLISEHNTSAIKSIHNQESDAEMQLFKSGNSDLLRLINPAGIPEFNRKESNSLAYAYPYLKNSSSIILVHNSFSDEESISIVDKEKTYWCLCPNANLYINRVLPPVDLFRKNELKIVIGTDSLASNHELNMLKELSAISKAYPHIQLEEMLRWVTINGAEALGISQWYGSFEKGKKPGMVNFLPEEELLNNAFTSI